MARMVIKPRSEFSKLWPGLAVLGLVLAVLAQACTRPPAQPTSQPPAPTQTPAPNATTLPLPNITPTATLEPEAFGIRLDALRDQVVIFWHPWQGQTETTLAALVREFNQNNPNGIRVEVQAYGSYSELHSAMLDGLRSGSLPTLTGGLNNQFAAWQKAGAAWSDLAIYANHPVVGFSGQEKTNLYPAFWEQEQANGQQTGLPLLRSAEVILYNTSWAQELGFSSPPTSPEAFAAQACAAAQALRQDADPANDSGGWLASTNPATTLGWLAAFGSPLEKSGGGYDFTNTVVSTTFSFLKSLFTDGCARQPDNLYPNPEFATRQALFITTSLSGLPFQEEANQQAQSRDTWTALPFPGPDGRQAMPVYGPSVAMLAQTPEENLAAWVFARFLLEPASQARLVEASGWLPVTAAALPLLADYQQAHLQWASAQQLSAQAQPEPRQASWSAVRGVLRDAAAIWYSDFPADNLSFLLEELQRSADELHALED